MKLGHARSGSKLMRLWLALGFIGVAGFGFSAVKTFALTYQSPVNVQFTWGSTLNLSLSSADITIANLAPGTYQDSNIITVSVNTNATFGYTLSAATGNGTTYTNTNLVNGSNTFTSLATTDSYSSMSSAGNNKWGYSYSTNSGSTWSNYSGLPYCTPSGGECTQGTALITTSNAADSKSIKFKIGAKASAAQPAGTYRNVVNFFVTVAPDPNA